jgi:hypothetical protein
LEREIARLLRLRVADAVIGKNDPGDLWVTPGPVKLHLCPPRLHRIFTKQTFPCRLLWRTSTSTFDMLPKMRDVAATLAKDARERGGVDVISIGPLWVEPVVGGWQYSKLIVY